MAAEPEPVLLPFVCASNFSVTLL